MKAVFHNYPCGHHSGDPAIPGNKLFHTVKCPACCGVDDQPQSAAVHSFREGFYPQLTSSEDKVYFTSKRQLNAEATKRGFESEYARD